MSKLSAIFNFLVNSTFKINKIKVLVPRFQSAVKFAALFDQFEMLKFMSMFQTHIGYKMHQLRQSATQFFQLPRLSPNHRVPPPTISKFDFCFDPSQALYVYSWPIKYCIVSILTKVSGRKSEQGILYSGLYSGKWMNKPNLCRLIITTPEQTIITNACLWGKSKFKADSDLWDELAQRSALYLLPNAL